MQITCKSKPYKNQAFELTIIDNNVTLMHENEVKLSTDLTDFFKDCLVFPDKLGNQKHLVIRKKELSLKFSYSKTDLLELEKCRDFTLVHNDPEEIKKAETIGKNNTILGLIIAVGYPAFVASFIYLDYPLGHKPNIFIPIIGIGLFLHGRSKRKQANRMKEMIS